ELICYDVINPTQYVFHEDTETCTPVYTKYYEDYNKFYAAALQDVEDAMVADSFEGIKANVSITEQIYIGRNYANPLPSRFILDAIMKNRMKDSAQC
ncbi:MAG: CatA-like O-acetyltransferase, partial [Lachnospiraceae bacterium]|nr:CatA-like O-acetyltransferase [Lachnospiraceae bacterium]